MEVETLNPYDYSHIVFFTGAGMSAESGVPTYRGRGGIWHEYRWEEYACQEAFESDPEKVLDFHELRRIEALKCKPHIGHKIIAEIEKNHPDVQVVTQNIDGMHQRAGSKNVIELHGSAWRMRCLSEGTVREDLKNGTYTNRKCECGSWLRPDIVWFSDYLDPAVTAKADKIISKANLFVSIGTSGVVWPAAGYPQLARSAGAFCIEINPEPSEQSDMYDIIYRGKAGEVLGELFQDSVRL